MRWNVGARGVFTGNVGEGFYLYMYVMWPDLILLASLSASDCDHMVCTGRPLNHAGIQLLLGGLICGVFLISIAVLYLVGAKRLADVMGDPKKKKSPRLLEIVSTARKVATLILVGVVVSHRVVVVWCHSIWAWCRQEGFVH